MLRDALPAIPGMLAIAVPAGIDAVTSLDIPIVATATLLAVVAYGWRLERRVGEHSKILGEHSKILDGIKEGILKAQGPPGT